MSKPGAEDISGIAPALELVDDPICCSSSHYKS